MKQLIMITVVVFGGAMSAVAQQHETRRGITGGLDEKTGAMNVRASQLMGTSIENSQGDDVGKIHDIVLDTKSGNVRYVAVTYGGLLGIGNKLFAVPYEAFRCQPDPDDRDRHIVVLDVTREQMQGAQGFDENQWPNFSDAKFTSELDMRYGIDRSSFKRSAGAQNLPRSN